MFSPWKRFSQRVRNIQIRMHFTNIYVSILNIISDGVETALDVLGLLVKPRLLGNGDSSSVVTEESHRARRAWNNSYVGDELLHPDSFMCFFGSSYVLSFTCRSRHDALLATAPADWPTIQN